MKPIKVFGEQAKEIKEGQVFVARVGSVEGRTVVTLEPKEIYDLVVEQECDDLCQCSKHKPEEGSN